MRTFFLFPLALAAIFAVPVHAADWVGPYVGANFGFGGGSWHASESGRVLSNGLTFQSDSDSEDIGVSGALGGVQAGYLWRFGSLVLGTEADADLLAITGSANPINTQQQSGGATNLFAIQVKTTADWLMTLRARAGIAQNKFLYYGTAGLAVAQVSYESTPLSAFFPTAKTSQALVGLAAGAGIEYAASESIGLRLEYLYVRLDDFSAQTNLSSSVTLPQQ